MAYNVVTAQHNPACSQQGLNLRKHLDKVCMVERSVAAEAQQLLE